MKTRDIAVLESALGYRFQRSELIEQALTHSSQARERESQQGAGAARLGDNEQLEFLGDAVLALLSSEALYRRFPLFHEGQLSKLRAHLVSEKHLAQSGTNAGTGQFPKTRPRRRKSGGRAKNALLADALEAVLAAIYLDGGLEAAREFVQRQVLHPALDTMESAGSNLPVTDFKSTLQETLQAAGRRQPAVCTGQTGRAGTQKTFTVEARLIDTDSATRVAFVREGRGHYQKRAEQEAARQVLDHLASLPTVIPGEDH